MTIPEIDYEAVFQSNPSAILLLTREFDIAAANRSYERMTGAVGAEIIGRNLYEVFPGGADPKKAPGPARVRASLERVLATGRRDTVGLQRYDVELPDRPGVFEPRYWSVINAPVFDTDGRVVMILHRVMEVTAFLTQLRQAHDHGITATPAEVEAMEAEYYTRVRELQQANEQLRTAHALEREIAAALRESVERQQRFVSDASHDLRSPLTGLQTRLEFALQDASDDPQQTIRSALKDAERLTEIVADLLELARLDAATPVSTEKVDLAGFVTEELGRRVSRVPVSLDLARGVIVDASPVRLARLLGNLLANAERHAFHRIEITVAADEDTAILQVADDGPGVPAADRDQIFERFHRLDEARRSDPGGTGLGLPIAREIARAHGGRLLLTDREGGACFVLRLPRSVSTGGDSG
ncbi:ATP-binding protein [Actinocorallia longicatena]|uniref:ATP-binding protein n=1 Tax=Actinocorallia longicatena TaxID=111803 RepID=UPI0031DFEE83